MEKLSFGHSMEALLAAAKPVLTPSLIAKLQALGLDPTKKLHGPWFCGIITAMVENAGAKDVKVSLARNDQQGAVFTILWSA